MLTAKLINDPGHWRSRAEEARAQADEMKDAGARRGMLSVAEGYQRLATMADAALFRELNKRAH